MIVIGLGSDLPVRVLAVVGGACLGAFVVGWLAQVLARLAFNQKVPPWPLWAVRLLGGLVCGWLVWLWLFGGGGGGIGGPGGWWGGGQGKGEADKGKPKEERPEKDKDRKKDKDKSFSPVPPDESLRVEVLGDAPLKKLEGKFDPHRRYRVGREARLLTLEEVQARVRKRRAGKPPLRRLEVVLYKDSPARDRPQVAALVRWAEDLDGSERLRVDFSEPEQDAPLE
jgi:hypothetical protein